MKFIRLASFVLGCLLLRFAWAQDKTDLVAPVLNDGIYRILVIGDSMAGGLGAGITRMAANQSGYEIVTRFNESSGLTRPDIYDWAGAIPKIMEGKNFNAVVVLIGLNDRQDIRTPQGRLTFNSPEWVKAYQANADAMMDALAASQAKIFWLGEPPMGDAAYDADMMNVTALQKARVVPKGAVFLDTRIALLSADGKYMDFGPDDTGELRKLRQRDGVTFLKQGNNKFGQIILAAIRNANDGKLPDGSVVAAGVPVTQSDGPVFGQSDANGQSVLHGANEVALANSSASSPIVQPVNPNAPVAGSAAEKLFTAGEAKNAPLGRFDDFSYVAPPPN